jgi:hypothetical protein
MQAIGTRARACSVAARGSPGFDGRSLRTLQQISHNFSPPSSSRRLPDSSSTHPTAPCSLATARRAHIPRQRSGLHPFRCLTRTRDSRPRRITVLQGCIVWTSMSPPLLSLAPNDSNLQSSHSGPPSTPRSCRIVRTREPRPTVLLSQYVTKCNLQQDSRPDACSEAVHAFTLTLMYWSSDYSSYPHNFWTHLFFVKSFLLSSAFQDIIWYAMVFLFA